MMYIILIKIKLNYLIKIITYIKEDWFQECKDCPVNENLLIYYTSLQKKNSMITFIGANKNIQ